MRWRVKDWGQAMDNYNIALLMRKAYHGTALWMKMYSLCPVDVDLDVLALDNDLDPVVVGVPVMEGHRRN